MNIRQKTVDVRELRLSPEEGFVLSRIDGTTTVKDLVALTGLDEARVVGVVERLVAEGAVEVDGAPRPSDEGISAIASHAPTDDADELLQEPLDSEVGASDDDAEHEEATCDDDPPAHDYRKIYESLYHPKTRDERVAAARDADGPHLLALCLDPEPHVIHAVLSNPRAGVEAARMIAAHHRTHAGLEPIVKRADFAGDGLVQRRLLRNPQLPAALLSRIVGGKRMMDVYKIAIDREIPERSRVMTREILRKKFTTASSDERAALLFKTEGRCLVLLVGCSLDARATQILCSKATHTVLFVQNLARWPATPPALLAHLLRMPLVRRNVGLRKMLLKHPNVPSEIKRSPPT